MAFYHTTGCICPEGDCWCGVENIYYNQKTNELLLIPYMYGGSIPKHVIYVETL